jgi:hypothetical protein
VAGIEVEARTATVLDIAGEEHSLGYRRSLVSGL